MSLIGKIQLLEFENETLHQRVKDLKAKVEQLEKELAAYKQPKSEKPLLTDSTQSK